MPQLIGILIRGMTFDGERWRLATIGDWAPTGSHLPQPLEVNYLKSMCRDFFEDLEHVKMRENFKLL